MWSHFFACLKSKSFIIWLGLLLLSVILYFASSHLIFNYVFLPKMQADTWGAMSAQVEGTQPRDRKILSQDDLRLTSEESCLTAWAMFEAAEEGTYAFFLEGDDYAFLQVDDTWVVRQHAGVSAHNQQAGELKLSAGPHLLYLELHNRQGQGWLKLSWKKPGQESFAPLSLQELNSLGRMGNFPAWRTFTRAAKVAGLLLLALSFIGLMVQCHRISQSRGLPLEEPFWVRAWIALAWVLGGALLFCRYIAVYIGVDASMTGRNALAVLNGYWPTFYADQGYPGCLDAYLTAPFYALFGPSVLILNLFPALFCLGMVLFLYPLLRRMFNPQGRAFALTLLMFPPAIVLYFAGEARMQYSMDLFLGAWLMHLSVSLRDRQGSWGWPRPFIWGLISAVMIWMHNGAITVVIPCFIYLLLADWRKTLRTLPWFILGGFLGFLPVLLYYVQYGSPPLIHEGLRFGERLLFLLMRGLPLLLGQELGLVWDTQEGTLALWLYVILALLFVWGLYYLIKGIRRFSDYLPLLPLMIIFFTVLSTLVSGREPFLVLDGRHHLLMWLGMPFCWAALGQRLSRFKLAAPLLALLLAVLNFPLYGTFGQGAFIHNFGGRGGPMLDIKTGFYLNREPEYQAKAEDIQSLNLSHIYVEDNRLAFYLGGKPWATTVTQFELYGMGLLQVEASLNPGFSKKVHPAARDWLGLPVARESRYAQVYSQPGWGDRLISLAGSRLRDLEGNALPPTLSDANLSSGLGGPPRKETSEERGFILELSRPELVGGFSLIPFHSGMFPDQMRLEGAGEDGIFHLIREGRGVEYPVIVSGPHAMARGGGIPGSGGIRGNFLLTRMEAFFTPRLVKYLRFTASSNPHLWSVRELRLSGPAEQALTLEDWAHSKEVLLKAMEEQRPSFVYADIWPGAVLRTHFRLSGPEVLEAGLLLKEFGGGQHLSDLDSYFYPRWFHPEAGQAVVLSAADAGPAQERLHTEGIAFTRQDLGALVLLRLQSAQTGALLPAPAVSAVEGHSLRVQLARPEAVQWISLSLDKISPVLNWPATLEFTLPDQPSPGGGGGYLRAHLAGPLAFTGQMILPAPHHQALYRLDKPVSAQELILPWPAPGLEMTDEAKNASWQVELFAPL